MNVPSGPLFKTQRVEIPGTGTYAELSQVRGPVSIHWEIETGSIKFGHSGTWGRSDVREARICFADAVAYAALHR